MEKSYQKLQELFEALKEECPNETTAVDIFITTHEQSISLRLRTAEGLKSDSISMKNLKGDFIH